MTPTSVVKAATPLRYPIKIVSDLHYKYLGARLTTPGHLKAIFEGFATVILNGDSVEEGYHGTLRAHEHRAEMVAAAKDVGAELIFVRGNHDPDNGVHEFQFVHKDRLLRVTHGDFGLVQLPNTPKSAFHRPIAYGWYIFKSFRSYPVYWRQIDMGFAITNDHEILILGHTHQPSVTRRGERVVVNLGAHMKGFKTGWIELHSGDSNIVFHGKSPVVL